MANYVHKNPSVWDIVEASKWAKEQACRLPVNGIFHALATWQMLNDLAMQDTENIYYHGVGMGRGLGLYHMFLVGGRNCNGEWIEPFNLAVPYTPVKEEH